MKKTKLHPRSYHNQLYNFDDLIEKVSELKEYIVKNPNGINTVDFSNPKVVYLLNKALLFHFYNLQFWEIPRQNLIPSIPGRADYIHFLADLIGYEKSSKKTILDIGTGASLVYPIIGSNVYDWNFVATDIDEKSIKNALTIIDKNNQLKNKIELRLQTNSKQILNGIIKKEDFFDALICNPPFFKSQKEAETQTLRKLKGLNNKKQPIKLMNNFSGKHNELWCEGGELVFLTLLVTESFSFKQNVAWFTSLVSNENNLKPLKKLLNQKSAQIKVIEMKQGNKVSRILAWKF